MFDSDKNIILAIFLIGLHCDTYTVVRKKVEHYIFEQMLHDFDENLNRFGSVMILHSGSRIMFCAINIL
jgi:hypothetical protein